MERGDVTGYEGAAPGGEKKTLRARPLSLPGELEHQNDWRESSTLSNLTLYLPVR